ncbi:hypothetical protein K3495_g6072 [Podosphaera aphanis]|nr:hypothetical protein K3495_g6072 [Podosphaera aphanis]
MWESETRTNFASVACYSLESSKVAYSSILQAVTASYSSILLRFPETLEKYFLQLYSSLVERTPQTTIFSFLLIVVTAFLTISMSSWGRSLWGSNRPRLSPFGSRANSPSVTKDDFSYITSSEIASSGQVYDSTSRLDSSNKLVEDDVLLVKCKGSLYSIKFAPQSIENGKVLVGELKKHLVSIMDLSEGSEQDLKLLYKGQELTDDTKSCSDYDIKNKSEIFCSTTQLSFNSDESGEVSENVASAKKKRIRGRKGKKAAMKRKDSNLSHQDGSATSRSTTPLPPPIQGPNEKLASISSHFHTRILPLCVQFTMQPPEDEKKKDFEHKKLSETIMNEVLLKLDAVETVGDNDAREKRRSLVREVQEVLNGLDNAMK